MQEKDMQVRKNIKITTYLVTSMVQKMVKASNNQYEQHLESRLCLDYGIRNMFSYISEK